MAEGADEEVKVLVERRRLWLGAAVAVAVRDPSIVGLWLVGSEGRGEADAFSDFDVFVALGGESLDELVPGGEGEWFSRFGGLVRCHEHPVNAPVDGRFFSAAYEAPIVAMAVDWYLQPSRSVQVGSDAVVLVDKTGLPRARPSVPTAGLFPKRAYSPPTDRGDRIAAQVDGFLVMVTIAAKYLCRGRDDQAEGIIDRLQVVLAAVAQEVEGRVGPWPNQSTSGRLRALVAAMRDLSPRLKDQGVMVVSTDEVESWLRLLARRRGF